MVEAAGVHVALEQHDVPAPWSGGRHGFTYPGRAIRVARGSRELDPELRLAALEEVLQVVCGPEGTHQRGGDPGLVVVEVLEVAAPGRVFAIDPQPDAERDGAVDEPATVRAGPAA